MTSARLSLLQPAALGSAVLGEAIQCSSCTAVRVSTGNSSCQSEAADVRTPRLEHYSGSEATASSHQAAVDGCSLWNGQALPKHHGAHLSFVTDASCDTHALLTAKSYIRFDPGWASLTCCSPSDLVGYRIAD